MLISLQKENAVLALKGASAPAFFGDRLQGTTSLPQVIDSRPRLPFTQESAPDPAARSHPHQIPDSVTHSFCARFAHRQRVLPLVSGFLC
jgi:hypothetical protein